MEDETISDELLLDYALGTLPPELEATVEAHLRAHPEGAAKVQAYLEDLALVTLALPPEPLPSGGEAALLARVRALPTPPSAAAVGEEAEPEPVLRAPPRRPRSGWWALAAAAALGVLYVLLLGPPGTAPSDTVAEQLERYERQAGSSTYALAHEATQTPLGTLVRLQDGRLFVALDAPPESGRVYQAWEIRGGTPLSLGAFEGRTLLTPATDAESVFGLTLEPPGGSDAPTTAPFVLLEL